MEKVQFKLQYKVNFKLGWDMVRMRVSRPRQRTIRSV